MPDFIALRGDPSDGLPGAPGVGAKTAAELLHAHGTLEGVVDAAAPGRRRRRAGGKPLSAKIARTIAEHAAELGDFREIATLQSVTVELPASAPTDYEGGAAVAGKLGMRRLAERLAKAARA